MQKSRPGVDKAATVAGDESPVENAGPDKPTLQLSNAMRGLVLSHCIVVQHHVALSLQHAALVLDETSNGSRSTTNSEVDTLCIREMHIDALDD